MIVSVVKLAVDVLRNEPAEVQVSLTVEQLNKKNDFEKK